MDKIREYVQNNKTQLQTRQTSMHRQIQEHIKERCTVITKSGTIIKGLSYQIREYFISKLKLALKNNYKSCGKQCKVNLTENNIDDIARKAEHDILSSVASNKIDFNYKVMALQKITEIEKNTAESELWAAFKEKDNENDQETQGDSAISDVIAFTEQSLASERESERSKINTIDSEADRTENTVSPLCHDFLESSSGRSSRLSDNICLSGDGNKESNVSNQNNKSLNNKFYEKLENRVPCAEECMELDSCDRNDENLQMDVQTIIKRVSRAVIRNRKLSNDNEDGAPTIKKPRLTDDKETATSPPLGVLKFEFPDSDKFGENFELLDQMEYGVMTFEDPDPDISAGEEDSEDDSGWSDFPGPANGEYIKPGEIKRWEAERRAKLGIVSVLSSDDDDDYMDYDDDVAQEPKKRKPSPPLEQPPLRNLNFIEEETLHTLKPILYRYLNTSYIPNYYYYVHIFRCIHEDILRKRIYDEEKLRIHAIKKIKSKKYYNYMHEMLGGKYSYIPRAVDDYMLSPEVMPYQLRSARFN